MQYHRNMSIADLMASSYSVEGTPQAAFESCRFAVIDGDGHALLSFATPMVPDGNSGVEGIKETTMRLPLRDAEQLVKQLSATIEYLRVMGENFNPDPPF